MSHPSRRAVVGVAASLALLSTLVACSPGSLSAQYRAGDNKGYIAAENGFQTRETAPRDRDQPISFTATLDNGSPMSSTDFTGKVLVSNFWYAACGPCIVEAPRLEQAHQTFRAEDVAFLGINTYDQGSTALSFARDNGVTYPSALAVNDAHLKLAFQGKTPLDATPTTLVLDKQTRVAAVVVGELPDASILEALVRTVAAETD